MGRGLLALGAMAAVTLLLIEGALRLAGLGWPLFYQYDEGRGVVLSPGAKGWYRREGRQYVRINGEGMRDVERSRGKPPGTFRVALLGDSFTEAMQVRREDSFAGRLEEELPRLPALGGRPVEVLNFGVSGFNTTQELLTLRERAWAFSPDLVVLVFFHGNDVRDASAVLGEPPARPLFRDGPAGPELDRSFVESDDFRRFRSPRGALLRRLVNASRVAQLGKEAFRVAELALSRRDEPPDPVGLGALGNAVFRPPETEAWREAWRLAEHALVEVMREAAAHGVPLLVVTATSGVQVHPDASVRSAFQRRLHIDDLDYPDARVAKLARARGVPALQLAPALRAVAERDGISLHGFDNAQPRNGHWNEAGHALVAHLIAGRIGSLLSP